MTYSSRLLYGIALAAVVTLGSGCRQSDGPLPVPEGDQANRIYDVSRDLQNVAAEVTGAPGELSDDLAGLAGEGAPPEPLAALSQALTMALAGKRLDDADAKALAESLFVVSTAQDLSARQIEQLQSDLTAVLAKVGADAEAAERVSTLAGERQTSVTLNTKRWYHLR